MEYKRLGNTGLQVSSLCLGTMTFGDGADDAARKHAVRKRLEEIAEDQSFEETYAIEFDKD